MRSDRLPHVRKTYWQRVRLLTLVLIAMWFAATFGTIFFARELSRFTLFGWPVPFYMAGQGLALFYLLIVGVYVRRMDRLDKCLKDECADAK